MGSTKAGTVVYTRSAILSPALSFTLLNLPFQQIPAFFKYPELLVFWQILQSPASQEDNVHRIESILREAKGLSNDTLDTVSANGKSYGFLGDNQSQSCMAELVASGQQQKIIVTQPEGGSFKHLPIAGCIQQPAGFAKLAVNLCRRACYVYGHMLSTLRKRNRPQAARRLRPRARRRLITNRPFLVDMRARKPWVRALFRTLG